MIYNHATTRNIAYTDWNNAINFVPTQHPPRETVVKVCVKY